MPGAVNFPYASLNREDGVSNSNSNIPLYIYALLLAAYHRLTLTTSAELHNARLKKFFKLSTQSFATKMKMERFLSQYIASVVGVGIHVGEEYTNKTDGYYYNTRSLIIILPSKLTISILSSELLSYFLMWDLLVHVTLRAG